MSLTTHFWIPFGIKNNLNFVLPVYLWNVCSQKIPKISNQMWQKAVVSVPPFISQELLSKLCIS